MLKKQKKEDKSIFSLIHDFFFGSKDDVSKENSSAEQADEKAVDTRKIIKLLKLLGKGGGSRGLYDEYAICGENLQSG